MLEPRLTTTSENVFGLSFAPASECLGQIHYPLIPLF